MTPTSVGMRCPECSSEKTQVRSLSSLQAPVQLTPVIIAVCLVVGFASGSIFGARGDGNTLFYTGALFGNGSVYGFLPDGLGDIANDGEYWRLITGGFLHSGLIHIGFNMYLLWMLGNLLEPVLGQVRFGLVYLTALLGGSFGALLLEPTAVTVGASGAVFGLMAFAFLELRSRGFDPMASGIGPLILLNLVITFLPGFNISIGGHLGGLLAGALCALVLQQASERRRRTLGLVALGVLCVVFAAGGVVAAEQTEGLFG
jgi:membrane associated rhomboid family serine protease